MHTDESPTRSRDCYAMCFCSGQSVQASDCFPGLQDYRKMRGVYQDLHTILPECYLHYGEIPGADSAIVLHWAKNFLKETENLRKNGQHLLLLLDGYSAHIQFATLNFFRQNRVIVIALPAHSSHRLQTLDVRVFAPYKSFSESAIHHASKVRVVLIAFEIRSIIANAYCKCMTISNIHSGFKECGIWDPYYLGTNVDNLRNIFIDFNDGHTEKPTMDELLDAYFRKERSLLRDADVEESGRIRICTTRGAHLTSEAVVDALEVRNKRRAKGRPAMKTTNVSFKDVREPRSALLHYAELADARHIQRRRLRKSRNQRQMR